MPTPQKKARKPAPPAQMSSPAAAADPMEEVLDVIIAKLPADIKPAMERAWREARKRRCPTHGGLEDASSAALAEQVFASEDILANVMRSLRSLPPSRMLSSEPWWGCKVTVDLRFLYKHLPILSSDSAFVLVNKACNKVYEERKRQLRFVGNDPSLLCISVPCTTTISKSAHVVLRLSPPLGGFNPQRPGDYHRQVRRAIYDAADTSHGSHSVNLYHFFHDLKDALPEQHDWRENPKKAWEAFRVIAKEFGTLHNGTGKNTLWNYFVYPSSDPEKVTLCPPALVMATDSSSDPQAAWAAFQILLKCPVMHFVRELKSCMSKLAAHTTSSYPEMMRTFTHNIFSLFWHRFRTLIESDDLGPYSLHELCDEEDGEVPPHPVVTMRELPRFHPQDEHWESFDNLPATVDIFREAIHGFLTFLENFSRRRYYASWDTPPLEGGGSAFPPQQH